MRSPKTVVKHKVLAYKFAFQPLGFYLAGIFYNAAFQLVHIFKTFVLKESARFFATDAPCTVHQQVFVFFMGGKVILL